MNIKGSLVTYLNKLHEHTEILHVMPGQDEDTGCRDPELRQRRDPSYRIRRHRQLQDHRNVHKQQGADIKEIIEVEKKN